jgi:hypothetical protein
MSVAAAASRSCGCFPASFRLPSVSSICSGVCAIANRVAAEVCTLPSSALSMALWTVTEAIGFEPFTAVVITTQAVYNSARLVQQYRSLDGDGWTNTSLKIIVFGLLVQEAAGAATVVEACSSSLSESITKAMDCNRDEKPIAECVRLLDPKFQYSVSVITRHLGNLTSIIQSDGKSSAFCYFSSLDERHNNFTKVCFNDINGMQTRVVKEVTIDIKQLLSKDLQPLQSKITIAAKVGALNQRCVATRIRPADFNLGNPVCFLAAMSPDEKIVQGCLNADQNPYAHTLKALAKDEFPMDFSDGKRGVSYVLSNWKEFGLNPYPNRPSQKEL